MTFETNAFEIEITMAYVTLETKILIAYITFETNVLSLLRITTLKKFKNK